jgi:YHS domain-containing protein
MSATAKDPICGMEVDIEPVTLSSQHQGQTFYFCSAGCKQAFVSDPAKYLGGGYKPSMFGAMLGRVKSLFGH